VQASSLHTQPVDAAWHTRTTGAARMAALPDAQRMQRRRGKINRPPVGLPVRLDMRAPAGYPSASMTARSHISGHTAWIAMMDLVCLTLGGIVGVALRLGHAELAEYVFGHIDGWLIFFGGVMLANYLAGSYRLQYTFSRFNLLVTWAFSLAVAVLILSLTSYTWFTLILGRGVLLYSIAAYSALALALKLLVYGSLFRNEVFLCRAVIIGTGERARDVRATMEQEHVLPIHRVVAFIRPERDGAGDAPRALDGVGVLEMDASTIEDTIRHLDAQLVVVALDDTAEAAHYCNRLKRLRFQGVEVMSPLNVAEVYAGRTPLDLINAEYLVQASMESAFPVVRRAKRIFDMMAAGAGAILTLPLMAAVAAAIKVSAPHAPVFYRQARVGHFGAVFRIMKFRTMVPDAERESGPVWAAEHDPRVTRLGRVLRRTRLDELPQLFNVLMGDMSLVGPRPERPEITKRLAEEIPFYAERENVLPGLTGWAQIRHPYGGSTEAAARKLEYDLYYIKHLSLSLDIQIILRTLRIVVLGMERRM
jgi:exopolysaccharide biosynthesis polyprenyl glycosylphosphotransferase